MYFTFTSVVRCTIYVAISNMNNCTLYVFFLILCTPTAKNEKYNIRIPHQGSDAELKEKNGTTLSRTT